MIDGMDGSGYVTVHVHIYRVCTPYSCTYMYIHVHDRSCHTVFSDVDTIFRESVK